MVRLAWLAALAAVAAGAWAAWGDKAQFVIGGAMMNIGYRLQDPLADYDLEHHESSPAQVWEELVRQNLLASSVRERFPRTARHPVVALVACMDGRLDTNEIVGDTRRY